MLLDPGGLVAASHLPELRIFEDLITETDSIEDLPKLRSGKLKKLAAMYLAMTTDLILYMASGGDHEVFGSTDANSQFLDQRKGRVKKIEEILHQSEIVPMGEEHEDRIEPGRETLKQLFQDWSDADERDEMCNSSRRASDWFKDYRKTLLDLIDPFQAYRTTI